MRVHEIIPGGVCIEKIPTTMVVGRARPAIDGSELISGGSELATSIVAMKQFGQRAGGARGSRRPDLGCRQS